MQEKYSKEVDYPRTVKNYNYDQKLAKDRQININNYEKDRQNEL
jgi:hypothetical protein